MPATPNRTRKTITVYELICCFNERIRRCPDLDGRRALCCMVESLMHENNAYAGFGYVYPDGKFVPAEVIQAVGWTDDYRHEYYIHNRLTQVRK